MPGYVRNPPGRQVVDEVISTGASVGSQISGVTSKQLLPRWQKWTGPFLAASSSVYVLAATAASSNNTTTIAGSSVINNPDFPRAVKLAPSTSQTASGNVVINGTNQWNEVVSDTIALGGAGALVNGAVAFKTITSIVLPVSSSGTGTQAAFSLSIGLSSQFGLDRQIQTNIAALRAAINGTVETTLPALTVSGSLASFVTAPSSSATATAELLYVHADVKHS